MPRSSRACARRSRCAFGELDSFADAAQDPAEDKALHDMRIAAKRVRYVLEVSEPVLPGAKSGVTAAKKLQDVLGEIHDCDELLPVIERHVGAPP